MSFDTRLRMSGVRPQSSLFPASPRGVNGPAGSLRKSLDLSSRCSWKCTAILFMLASAVLAAAVAYLTGNSAAFDSFSYTQKKSFIRRDPETLRPVLDGRLSLEGREKGSRVIMSRSSSSSPFLVQQRLCCAYRSIVLI